MEKIGTGGRDSGVDYGEDVDMWLSCIPGGGGQVVWMEW